VKAVAWIGLVQLSAMTALTSPSGGHDLGNIGARGLRQRCCRPAKNTQRKKTKVKKTRKGRRRFVEGLEEDTAEEHAHFQIDGFTPLSARR
jgi:hypothetical protein